MNHEDFISYWARNQPDRIAFDDPETAKRWTYGQLESGIRKVCYLLSHRYEIQPGDRVAVLAQNEIETVLLFYSLRRLRSILIPINTRLTAHETRVILDQANPKLTFFQGPFLSHVEGFAAAPFAHLVEANTQPPSPIEPNTVLHPQDPCMILYTSGTTGLPKGCLITNQMILWNSMTSILRLGLNSSDVTMAFAPLFHTGGWNVLLNPFIHFGGSQIFLRRFDPETILNLIPQKKVTLFFGVPTMLDLLSRSPSFHDADLSSLRCCIVGGEAMPVPLIETFHMKGVPIRQGYGLTEFGPNVFSLDAEYALSKRGSIGTPNPFIEIKCIGPDGEPVSSNTIGELCLKGPACTPGYFQDEKATRDLIRDNWLHTGDLVRTDDDGFTYVVGRKKDMYISGGENVYPSEVERWLQSHSSIRDVAVIGIGDPKWGEVGVAFLIPNTPTTEDVLIAHCAKGLAKFKIPKYFIFLPEFPRSSSGKVLKTELRRLYENGKNNPRN